MKTFLTIVALVCSVFFAVLGCVTGNDLPQAEWELFTLIRYEEAVRYTIKGERNTGLMQVWRNADDFQVVVFVDKPTKRDSTIGLTQQILIKR